MINIVVSIIILGIGMVSTGGFAQNNWTLFFAYAVVFILALLYGRRRFTHATPELTPFSFHPASSIVFVILFFSTIAILLVLDPIVNLIPMPDWFYRILSNIVTEHGLANFLMLSVAAPILEESIFRGIVLNGFLQNYSPRKAIIWSALIFGVVHFNPWQFIPALVLGLFIGWVYWKTGSLLPGMFIHFVANTSSFVLSFFVDLQAGREVTTAEMIGNPFIYMALLLIAVVVILFGISRLAVEFSAKGEKVSFP